MSKIAIHQYYNKVDQYKRFGGTRNELSLRRAFANLLEEYCLSKNLILVDEIHLKGTQKRPDGTVKDALQLDWGYWESKDPKDNLSEAVTEKLMIGYPTFNILFENSIEILLIQHGEEVLRAHIQDEERLDRILTQFVEYERPEIIEFHKAIEKFKEDLPDILEHLRKMLENEGATNLSFQKARDAFWKLCQKCINPDISAFDIREMLIQHILTAEIFNTIFGESHFHRENNIAHELEQVIQTFFTGAVRRNTLGKIDSYYKTIQTEAARIDNHHEKQKFLKVIYENFYKAYNPKGADKLGIVYTPNEIVRFMVESVDYLLDRHFKRSLSDRDVEILDPATGTGTFITDIIEYIPEQYLEEKYEQEIHANEIAILPYYIANLNIEYTYWQKKGVYKPFEHLVFVDTLENLGFKGITGKQELLFGLSAENLKRIKEQNLRTISVIIGNPPYNAVQASENLNNRNRKYPELDKRMKETFVKYSNTQNINRLYDPYIRFFRWAMDRIAQNGIIALITNRSYIEHRTFDGFRKMLPQEFDHIYIIDTQSDVRKNPKIAGTTHNVFGIQTGVAVIFLIKSAEYAQKQASIHYLTLTDEMRKREKLQWFRDATFKKLSFTTLHPDEQGNWLNITNNDFDEFIPLYSDGVRNTDVKEAETAIFKLYSLGLNTNRDEWAYDHSAKTLKDKMRFLIDVYNQERERYLVQPIGDHEFDLQIKWDSDLKKYVARNIQVKFHEEEIIPSLYRPFSKRFLYFNRYLNARQYQWRNIPMQDNRWIAVPNIGSPKDFCAMAATDVVNLNFHSGGAQCLPLYRYSKTGSRMLNITDWGVTQFIKHYHNTQITCDDIFCYVYAVLHHPGYCRTYAINLKRETPRIPFYRDFSKWVNWGKALMELHINYETVEPYPLTIQEAALRKETPKAKLRAIPEDETIIIDENTTLLNIPKTAWEYKLGNRSALHWILDQYKEKTRDDPTIAARFNTYKFADYKATVLDLLQRVCTVSVKTVDIMNAMEQEEPYHIE